MEATDATDILQRADEISGTNINYREETLWYDQSPLTDEKCDGVIYRKKDGKYYRKTIASDFIPKIDNIQQLRIFNAYYAGQEVMLLGYYNAGDKDILRYRFTVQDFDTLVDDGGSVIKTDKGSWIAQFPKAVDVRDFGAKTDDNPGTAAANFAIIKKVLEKYNNVIFKNGEYQILHPSQTSYFLVQPNSTINFENAKIKVVGNNFTRFYVFYIQNVSNVKISNAVIIGDKLSHLGSTGEWGYGIFISNSNQIELNNITCNENWGDGITINGGNDIKVYNSTFDNNRRQGCSIGKVGSVDFYNCRFSNTDGTNPGYGVDIENDYAGNNIKARFYDCIFDSNGETTSYPAGFCLSTHLAANPNPNDPSATTTKYEVELFNPIFINNGLITTSSAPAYGYFKIYNPKFYNTVRSALYIVDNISDNFLTQIFDPQFIDCVTTTTPNNYDNVIATQINGSGTVGTKNVHIIRPYITNSLGTKNQAVRIFEGSTKTTGENFKIEDLYVDKGFTFPFTLGDGTQPTLHAGFNLTFHKDCLKATISTNSSIGPNFNQMNAVTTGISGATNTIYMQTGHKISDSTFYLENKSLTADMTVNFGVSATPTTSKVFPYQTTAISSFKIKPGGWIKYKKVATDAINIIDQSGLTIDNIITIPTATESVLGLVKKSVAVANVATTNTVPVSLTDINTVTIADLVAVTIADLVTMSTADATTVSTADATDSTTTQALVNELKAKINIIVTFINELKAKANLNVTLTNDEKARINLNVLLTNDEKNRINLLAPLVNDIKSKYNGSSTLANELRLQVNSKLTADRNSGQQT